MNGADISITYTWPGLPMPKQKSILFKWCIDMNNALNCVLKVIKVLMLFAEDRFRKSNLIPSQVRNYISGRSVVAGVVWPLKKLFTLGICCQV